MPCRQDAAAVFDTYADYFGAQRARQAQLIGDGGRQEDGRRVVALGGGGPYAFVAFICCHVLVFGLGAVVPVVSYDTVYRGRRTGIDARMPGCRIRRHIIIMRVLAGEAFAEEAFEAARSVFVVIPVQVVIAHLVHYDPHHQAGLAGFGGGGGTGLGGKRRREGQEQRCEQDGFSHGKKFSV